MWYSPLLTAKQREGIRRLVLQETWRKIQNEIMTPKQAERMEKNRQYASNIAFELEEIFKPVAAHFGLAALSAPQKNEKGE